MMKIITPLKATNLRREAAQSDTLRFYLGRGWQLVRLVLAYGLIVAIILGVAKLTEVVSKQSVAANVGTVLPWTVAGIGLLISLASVYRLQQRERAVLRATGEDYSRLIWYLAREREAETIALSAILGKSYKLDPHASRSKEDFWEELLRDEHGTLWAGEAFRWRLFSAPRDLARQHLVALRYVGILSEEEFRRASRRLYAE